MLVKRGDLERREERDLAPYAMRSRLSRGRRHKEPEDEFRTCWQRDRDRIIHSTAFRRLEYKTQVFVNHEGDYYRTRLTHTIEVAQISRAVARDLALNEDLASTIALAHDIGHTPFGHSGERALDRLLADEGGFDHNWQGLRVVDMLERRYPNFPGLNLTHEVREAIAKHCSRYDPGTRYPDIEQFEPRRRVFLEAQVVDAADSIAYDNHDIDDSLKAGLITHADLLETALWREVEAILKRAYGKMEERTMRHQGIRHLINLLISDLVRATDRRLEEVGVAGVDDVRDCETRLVGHSQEVAEMKAELERFLHRRVYQHHHVVRMARKAERFVRDLFDAYTSEPLQLPPEFRRWADEVGLERAAADYIAGMTDRFAQEEHIRLFSPFERGISR